MGIKPRTPATPPEPSSPPNETELPEQWSVQGRGDLVLQLLRGEALDAVSRESRVRAHELGELEAHLPRAGGRAGSRRGVKRELTLARRRVDDALRLAEHLIDKRTHGRVEEAMAMRRALSPRTGQRYKLTLICAFFRVSRSTV
jgi:hypothetical protein